MNLDCDFSRLRGLVLMMRATAIKWHSEGNYLEKFKIENHLSDWVETNFDQIVDGDNGLLFYRGNPSVCYLRKTNRLKSTTRKNSLPRFHVSNCLAVKKIRASPQSNEKFIVTHNTSGEYQIWFTNSKGVEVKNEQVKLNVCRHCLINLNYKNYAYASMTKRRQIENGFSFRDFLYVFGY